MGFPNDLSDVAVLKIHPAIGIARVSKNDDYFTFGEIPDAYKSNGLLKRQAVKFRLFAYGENHVGLGEITPEIAANLGAELIWSAKVANRKVAHLEGVPLSSNEHVISAHGTSHDENNGLLTGTLPDFEEGEEIPMGQITADGLFIPPKAGVFHKSLPAIPVPNFPNFTPEIADTTSDGIIGVELSGVDGAPDVLEACIVVAPGDYSPDVDSEPIRSESLLVRLKEDIATEHVKPTNNLHNRAAKELDMAALRPCTGDFAPGYEVSFGAGEVNDIRSVFHRSDQNPLLDPREIRVKYKKSTGDTGAVPGQLTSGLCSPWQTDFTACTGYWSENLPTKAFLDENDQQGVLIYRHKYNDHRGFIPESQKITTGDEHELHQDKIGVARLISGRLIETERDPGDDIN